jgi:hypothetical protein
MATTTASYATRSRSSPYAMVTITPCSRASIPAARPARVRRPRAWLSVASACSEKTPRSVRVRNSRRLQAKPLLAQTQRLLGQASPSPP